MSALKRKMLIIEDDEALRSTLLDILRAHEYEVVGAADGQEGLNKLRLEKNVDLILLDMHMPVKDGKTFRMEQLSDPEISEVPVILLTADYHHKDNLDLKPYEFLNKPVELSDLLNIINGFFILHKSSKI